MERSEPGAGSWRDGKRALITLGHDRGDSGLRVGTDTPHSEAGEQLEAKIRSQRADGSDIYFMGRGAKPSERPGQRRSFAEPEFEARPDPVG